jgi:hypothetical protein
MKNLVVTVIIAVAVMASFSKAKAQYAIPSFDVPVYVNTTFHDGSGIVAKDQNGTREERKLRVRVNTSKSPESTWVYISVYKIGSGLSMGPFLVEDGQEFSMDVDEDLWGISVLSVSNNCYLSVWKE